MMPRRTIGIAESIISGIGFGFVGIVAKASFQAGFTPGENLAMRFLVASALLWITVLIMYGRNALLPRKGAVICLLLGIFGYAIFSNSYFTSLKGLSVSVAVLILYTYPILVGLGTWLLYKQRPSNRKIALMPVMVVGLALLVWGDMNIASSQALFFAVASAVLYALYIILSSKFISHINPLLSVCYIQTGAGITLALIYLRDAERTYQLLTNSWHLVLILAIFCTVIPMLLFLRSLQKLPAATVSMLSTTEPITGIIAASVLLGERMSMWQLMGAAIMLVMLILTARDQSEA